MSKSKNNLINVFAPEKQLRKQVMRIETDSTPLEAPKDPDSCTVFVLFQLIASPEEAAALRQQYTTGVGYGHAKQQLFEALLWNVFVRSEAFDYYMLHPEEIEIALAKGASRAREVAMKYYFGPEKTSDTNSVQTLSLESCAPPSISNTINYCNCMHLKAGMNSNLI